MYNPLQPLSSPPPPHALSLSHTFFFKPLLFSFCYSQSDLLTEPAPSPLPCCSIQKSKTIQSSPAECRGVHTFFFVVWRVQCMHRQERLKYLDFIPQINKEQCTRLSVEEKKLEPSLTLSFWLVYANKKQTDKQKTCSVCSSFLLKWNLWVYAVISVRPASRHGQASVCMWQKL